MKRTIFTVTITIILTTIIVMFYVKGITIHKTYNQQQYQNQQQAQVVIGLYALRGYIKWNPVTIDDMRKKFNIKGETDMEVMANYLNILQGEQSLLSVPVEDGLIIPEFIDDGKYTRRPERRR